VGLASKHELTLFFFYMEGMFSAAEHCSFFAMSLGSLASQTPKSPLPPLKRSDFDLLFFSSLKRLEIFDRSSRAFFPLPPFYERTCSLLKLLNASLLRYEGLPFFNCESFSSSFLISPSRVKGKHLQAVRSLFSHPFLVYSGCPLAVRCPQSPAYSQATLWKPLSSRYRDNFFF